MMNVFVRECVA